MQQPSDTANQLKSKHEAWTLKIRKKELNGFVALKRRLALNSRGISEKDTNNEEVSEQQYEEWIKQFQEMEFNFNTDEGVEQIAQITNFLQISVVIYKFASKCGVIKKLKKLLSEIASKGETMINFKEVVIENIIITLVNGLFNECRSKELIDLDLLESLAKILDMSNSLSVANAILHFYANFIAEPCHKEESDINYFMSQIYPKTNYRLQFIYSHTNCGLDIEFSPAKYIGVFFMFLNLVNFELIVLRPNNVI
jgi:hypothetical protein